MKFQKNTIANNLTPEFPLLVVTITVDAAKYIATRLMVPARHTRMNEEQESPINLQPIPHNIFMLRNK